MSTTATPVALSSLPEAETTPWIPGPLYRISVEQYEAMTASGAIPESHRVHLINGLLVQKMTQKPPHVVADELCGSELLRVIPSGWHLRTSKPVRLPAQFSEPEPDRTIARGTIRDYEGRHPGPGDIALVVEISDSSLAEDRKLATEVYGPAGIPVYWLVNLVDRQVEVYSEPGPGGYRSSAVYAAGHTIPVVIDGREAGQIAVEDILPRHGK